MIKRIIRNTVLVTYILLGLNTLLGKVEITMLKGPYLGQQPPGMIPKIFAPGIVSTGYDEHIATFTPDGKELYFRMLGAPHSVILFMKEENGRWTKPQVAPFSGKYGAKCLLSPDGNKIAISMGSPLDGKGEPKENWQIWIAERTDTGWSEPKNLGPPVNSEHYSVAYPTLSTNGNLYFYSDNRKGGMGKGDIWMSKFVEAHYTEPQNLGDTINTEFGEVDPFIAPDESYLIFISNRPGGYGNTDIYISFRKKDGSWTKAQNMGNNINTKAGAGCPSVSPDSKYFFFSSNRTIYKNYSETPITYEKKIKILNSPGNGSEDIYWMDAKIIDELKPDDLK
jgi:hypothetical protein